MKKWNGDIEGEGDNQSTIRLATWWLKWRRKAQVIALTKGVRGGE